MKNILLLFKPIPHISLAGGQSQTSEEQRHLATLCYGQNDTFATEVELGAFDNVIESFVGVSLI